MLLIIFFFYYSNCRAHLNDIENIFLFILLGLMYVSIQPELATALLCFRIFTAARYVHSLVYIGQVRQPARVLAFGVGVMVSLYMTYAVLSAVSR